MVLVYAFFPVLWKLALFVACVFFVKYLVVRYKRI